MQTGTIRAADTARPISGAALHGPEGGEPVASTDAAGRWQHGQPVTGAVTVSAPGYVDKHFRAGTLPETVRLMPGGVAFYLDRFSAFPGESFTAHVHAPSGAALHAAPHDPAKGKGDALGDIAPRSETTPDTPFVAAGLDWSGTPFTVPERPGLHVVSAKGADGSSACAPLIIRRKRDAARAPVLALASAATWACYNTWGGRSRYRTYETAPASAFRPGSPVTKGSGLRRMAGAAVNLLGEGPRTRLKRALGADATRKGWVSDPLSFRRPWDHDLGLDAAPDAPVLTHLAGLDAKILAWLDRQGIDHECAADIDLETEADICGGRAAILLLGHSEYWSHTMFDRLKTAHLEGGAWVLNLSGNSIYRRIDVTPGESLRLSDIVFHLGGQDETVLTGGRYAEAAYGLAEPYRATRPDHWIFGNASLPADGMFGQDCLIANTPVDDRFYAPGRPSTPDTMLTGPGGAAGFEVDRLAGGGRKLFTVIAEGESGHGAQMAVKEPSGKAGGAFTACSISFGGALSVDPVCSAILRNVLDRSLSCAA